MSLEENEFTEVERPVNLLKEHLLHIKNREKQPVLDRKMFNTFISTVLYSRKSLDRILWVELLGKDFIEEYKNDKVDDVANDVFQESFEDDDIDDVKNTYFQKEYLENIQNRIEYETKEMAYQWDKDYMDQTGKTDFIKKILKQSDRSIESTAVNFIIETLIGHLLEYEFQELDVYSTSLYDDLQGYDYILTDGNEFKWIDLKISNNEEYIQDSKKEKKLSKQPDEFLSTQEEDCFVNEKKIFDKLDREFVACFLQKMLKSIMKSWKKAVKLSNIDKIYEKSCENYEKLTSPKWTLKIQNQIEGQLLNVL